MEKEVWRQGHIDGDWRGQVQAIARRGDEREEDWYIQHIHASCMYSLYRGALASNQQEGYFHSSSPHRREPEKDVNGFDYLLPSDSHYDLF